MKKIKDFFTNLVKKYENLGFKAKKKIKFVIGRIFLYYVLVELAFLQLHSPPLLQKHRNCIEP